MGCNGCSKKTTSVNRVDQYGNPVKPADTNTTRTASKDSHQEALDMSYAEYIRSRNAWREQSRKAGQAKVETFTDDYKRIQIEELIAVYNLEEVHFKLTPEQALAALYEFIHNPVYIKVVDEFEGLREQVDSKFNALKSNRINVKWRP